MTYTIAALADVLLLVGGWLFLRQANRRILEYRASAVVATLAFVLAPLMWFGVLYLVLYLALVLPGCPGGRWAC